jgi:hypothetical protein
MQVEQLFEDAVEAQVAHLHEVDLRRAALGNLELLLEHLQSSVVQQAIGKAAPDLDEHPLQHDELPPSYLGLERTMHPLLCRHHGQSIKILPMRLRM